MKEMKELEDRGIPFVSVCCCPAFRPLIRLSRCADNAREKARGAKAIGTTGRGIGPAYEDSAARRGLRVGDPTKKLFAEKLKEVMEYHNFQLLTTVLKRLDYQKVLMIRLAAADILTSGGC